MFPSHPASHSAVRIAGILLLTTATARVFAADAAFTPDNKKVVQIEPEERHTLLEIDPAAGTSRKLFEPGTEVFLAVTLDRHDRFLLATEKAIWSWKQGDAKPARLADLPAATEGWQAGVEDLAADPKSDRLLVTTRETKEDSESKTPAWIYETGKKEWGKVRCRYVAGIETPCFNSRGELCFSVDGDLWHGLIEVDIPWTLVAGRYAAVATLFTYNGSPMQSGVSQLAVSGGQLIMNHSRLGGSGWGTIYSLPAPPAITDDASGAPDLKQQLATAGRIGTSLKELGDGEGIIAFGNSRDGSSAWIMWPSTRKGLLITGGKKTPVELK